MPRLVFTHTRGFHFVQVLAYAVCPVATSLVTLRETKSTTTVGAPMPGSTEPCPLEDEGRGEGEGEGPLDMLGKAQEDHTVHVCILVSQSADCAFSAITFNVRLHTCVGWGDHTGPIYFYNRGEPYYEFTNFYQAVVKIDGEDWLTTEHYFQAQKFVGTPLVGTIRLMERPREAFDKSRDPRYSHWRRSDWEEVKEDIMFKALQAKFTQHEDLKGMLLGTKDRRLVERSPYDSYWGDGGDGSGKNRLGELLMRLRDDLTPKPAVRAPSPQPPIHPWPPRPSSPVNTRPQKTSPVQPEPTQQKVEEWCELKLLPESTPTQQQDPDRDGPDSSPHSEQPPQNVTDHSQDEEHDDGLAPQPTEEVSNHLSMSDQPKTGSPKHPVQVTPTPPVVHGSDTTPTLSSQPETVAYQMTMTASGFANISLEGSPSSQQSLTGSADVNVAQQPNDLASTSTNSFLHSTANSEQQMTGPQEACSVCPTFSNQLGGWDETHANTDQGKTLKQISTDEPEAMDTSN